MKVNSLENLERNKVQLEIAVDADAFNAAIDKIYKKQVKKINVPGFRKGKAPKKMIERLYGEGIFFEDAINELYPEALEAAIEEKKLEIVARPEVEMVSVSKEEGFVFKAVCITKPEVEVKDYKGLSVEKPSTAVSDAEVDEEIEKMRQRNARTITAERAAQNGDVAVIDFEGFVDGVAFEGGKGENFSLTLGSGQFIPGFEEQVVGKNAGDEFDVNVTFPEEYHAEELKGKAAVFKVKLHEVQSKELPELDDEFAKDVSEHDTLDALKESIKSTMAERKENQAQTEVENKLIDQIIEGMTGEIPQVMFDQRVDEMVRDFEMRLQQQGMKLDLYLQYTGMDLGSFRKTFEEQAQKTVKIRLALEKIVALEGIVATDEDVAAEYEKLAEKYGMKADDIKQYIPQADIAKDLALNKAIDLVKETAQVTQAKAPAKKPAAKKTTKATDEKEPAKKPAAKSTTTKSTATKSTTTKSTDAKTAKASEEKPAAKTASKSTKTSTAAKTTKTATKSTASKTKTTKKAEDETKA